MTVPFFFATLLLTTFVSAQEQRRVIVQFAEPPLTRRTGLVATTAYRETFERFRSDLSAIEPAAATPGGTVARVDREYFRTFNGVSVRITRRDSLGALARLPYVTAVHPDLEVIAHGSLGPAPVRVEQAASAGGAGVLIAVIDSGIDYTHPALGSGIGPGRKVVGGFDFVNDDDDPMDDNRHGTHVAGIVAAKSATLSGVAPDASLLAYKVLDGAGKGRQSDVIAAIERAIDPDGNGDLSDRADVANLSLGSRGNPLDPVAQAVENATAAGMLVVAASGNDGLFHAVSSPAVAESAIAVGASDATHGLADFTNCGPAPRSGAIKPDVLAPGVGIRSTALGGGTLVLSGTSMATPYVSGVAALLVAAHPDWSPAQIKSTIVSTAMPLPGVEVMAQGAGEVDPLRAAAASSWSEPSQLNFGIADLGTPAWTATGTILLHNDSGARRQFTISTTGTSPAIDLTAPATITLEPHTSREVTVSLRADPAALGEAPTGSFAFGGLVVFASTEETLRVPWAFLKAARLLISYDHEFPLVAVVGRRIVRGSFAILDPRTAEALVEPGVYDVIVAASWPEGAELHIAENLSVAGNVTREFRAADANHVITLDARDPSGAPFVQEETPTAVYLSDSRLLLTGPEGPTSLQLDRLPGKTLHTSSFSERFALLFTESHLDGARALMQVAQHEIVRGLSGSRTLTRSGSEFQSRDVHLRFPAGSSQRKIGILARGEVRRPDEIGINPLGVLVPADGDEWHGTLRMTPEVHPDYASGVQLFVYSGHPSTQGLAAAVTPMLRLTSNGFVSMRPFDVPPVPVGVAETDSFDFRSGPHFPTLVMSGLDQGWSGTLQVTGQRFETRALERSRTTYRVWRAGGNEIASGPVGLGNPLFISLPERGSYRATLLVGEAATLDVTFDTRGDGTPPALTSFAVLDGSGRKVSRLMPNATGALVFSVADYVAGANGDYVRLPGSPKLSFRGSGTGWVQLGLEEGTEETTADGRLPVGRTFRADLSAALALSGTIDVRIEVADAAGNQMVWTTPAFEVEPRSERRRAVRK
jgi:hypothetical protein